MLIIDRQCFISEKNIEKITKKELLSNHKQHY